MNRRKEPRDAPQHVRIGEEPKFIDVVVAARSACQNVIAARQRAFGDDFAKPGQLGKS